MRPHFCINGDPTPPTVISGCRCHPPTDEQSACITFGDRSETDSYTLTVATEREPVPAPREQQSSTGFGAYFIVRVRDGRAGIGTRSVSVLSASERHRMNAPVLSGFVCCSRFISTARKPQISTQTSFVVCRTLLERIVSMFRIVTK